MHCKEVKEKIYIIATPLSTPRTQGSKLFTENKKCATFREIETSDPN